MNLDHVAEAIWRSTQSRCDGLSWEDAFQPACYRMAQAAVDAIADQGYTLWRPVIAEEEARNIW